MATPRINSLSDVMGGLFEKYAGRQMHLWGEEDEQKHPRDAGGRWTHAMSRGEFHQQEKAKPGYDPSATNKAYWAAVKQAAAEGKEIHPKADEEHRQIFGEPVPRPVTAKEPTTASEVSAGKDVTANPGELKTQTPQATPATPPLEAPKETFVRGDRARFTGKTEVISGGTFHEVEFLEGHRKGQRQLVRDEAESAAEAKAKQAEWQEQQEGFRRLRESQKPAETPRAKAIRKIVEDFGEKIGGARKDTARPLGSRGKKTDDENDTRPAWARRYDIGQIEKSTNKAEEGKWSITDKKDTDWMGQPKQKGGLFNSKEEAEAALPQIAVSRNHRVSVERGSMKENNREFAIVRIISERKRAVVKGGFTSDDDARKYMAAHAQEIIEHQFPRYEDFAYLDHVERQGPKRRDGNVKATKEENDFQKLFSFRGGEFGKWQENKDGQTSLNHAFDALHDLSDAVGLPLRGVALNGDLAIAFGARGTGGKNSARAHYEPEARVMNLTKMKGAGSLAHEWAHALDHHLGGGAEAISKPTYKTKLRTELADAAKVLRNAMNGKQIDHAVQAPKEEADEVADLKAKHPNAAAETLRVVGPETVRGHLHNIKGSMNDARRWKAERSKKPLAPLSAADNKEWDDLSAKIAAGDVGAKKSDEGGRLTYENVDQLNKLFKKHAGRSFHTGNWQNPSAGHYLVSSIERKIEKERRAKEAGEGVIEKRTIPTDFLREATRMDETQIGNYYSEPHEMLARAFEAYVADKLQEKGIRSDYLVSRRKTDNAAYAMFGLKPFPEGDERKQINAAFDQFFAALKHQSRSDERGEHIQLYSRRVMVESVARELVRYSLRTTIERAAAETSLSPSLSQIEAGNYRKGRFRLWGKEIVIENPRGSTRSGQSTSGKPWSVETPAHYGYIRQHISEADKDHIDVYVGRHPESEVVFVVDQHDPDSGHFDEHKTFVGFRSAKEVRATYLAGFANGGRAKERFGHIATLTKPQFLKWLDTGDTAYPISGTRQVVKYAGLFDESKHPRGQPENAGEFATAKQPSKKEERELSDQEISERDYAQNFNDVSADPPKAKSRNLNRALGYLASMDGHYRRQRDRGEITPQRCADLIDSNAREAEWYKQILKERGDYTGPPYSDERTQQKSPAKSTGVVGQQQSLFGGTNLKTGQKSLFNVIAPDKPKAKTASANTGDLFAGLKSDLVEHLKSKATLSPADRGIVVQDEALPGQKELFIAVRRAIEKYRAEFGTPEYAAEQVQAMGLNASEAMVKSMAEFLARRAAISRGERPPPRADAWSFLPKKDPPSTGIHGGRRGSTGVGGCPRGSTGVGGGETKPSSEKWIKVGGASVVVNKAGRIIKGCPGLKGHRVSDLIGESQESRDRRDSKQAHAEARGLTGHDLTADEANRFATKKHQAQHQAAKSSAKKQGVATSDVLARMPDAEQLHHQSTGRTEELKSRARQLSGMNAGVLARVENAHRDHSTVPHFDEVVASLQQEFADVNFGDDPADFVWQTMRQGKAAKQSHEDIASSAAEMVGSSKPSRAAMISAVVSDVFDTSFDFGANAGKF